jgi:PmbA protein
MEELMELAKKVSEEVEIYSVDEKNDLVLFENSKLKNIESKIQTGLSLRIINDGKLGFAYTKDLVDREELLQNALDSIAGGIKADFNFPGSFDFAELKSFDKSIESLSNNDIVSECKRVNEILKSKTEGQINLYAERNIHKVRIINSNGLDRNFKSSIYSFEPEILYPASYSAIGRVIIDKKFRKAPDEYLDFLLDIYNQSLKEVNPEKGRMKALFLPEVMYVIIWRVLSATNGKSIYQKESPLSSKIGERIFSEKITIYDDPLNDEMPDARGFDDEGVPCKYFPIIENGVLKNFFYDLYYAKKMNTKSTGHGYKSGMWGGETISMKPTPSLDHLYMRCGDKSFDELISYIDRGIIVGGALGAHSGNIPNGDFSIGLSPGIYIENGEIIGRVKDAMIAGNIYETMKNVIDIEDTIHHAFTGMFPAMLFDDVSVATKD